MILRSPLITIVLLLASLCASAKTINVVLNDQVVRFECQSMKVSALAGLHPIQSIVLDAGHGGHDGGCHGKLYNEKDITLKVALLLGAKLEENYPQLKVIYTRKTDEFIPLHERVGLANKTNADLFISIHCNWISHSNTRGTETFVMGMHRADDNLEVAKRENSAILLESNYEANYEGFDPNSPIGHIILSAFQDTYVAKSIQLASQVERELKSRNFTHSRGVKQAGFAVLRRATMPAILVETGFLSHPDEEKYLGSDSGQDEVANALLRSIKAFGSLPQGKKPPVYADKADKTISKEKTSRDNNAVNNPDANKSTFRVQIAALGKDISKDLKSDKKINAIGNIYVEQVSDLFKYSVGDFASRDEAVIAKGKLQSLGYPNAFLTVK